MRHFWSTESWPTDILIQMIKPPIKLIFKSYDLGSENQKMEKLIIAKYYHDVTLVTTLSSWQGILFLVTVFLSFFLTGKYTIMLKSAARDLFFHCLAISCNQMRPCPRACINNANDANELKGEEVVEGLCSKISYGVFLKWKGHMTNDVPEVV